MQRTTAALLLVLIFCSAAWAAKPQAGDKIPDAQLALPLRPAEAAYLGLPEGAKGAKLSQIKADYLLVEIYSMYCPRCQVEAPAVGRLFEKLKASPKGQSIKFVAIGAGNSAFEVDVFRKKYACAYPLVADSDYVLHKLFMAVGTPSYFLLKPAPGGGFSIVFFQEGQFGDEGPFLDLLLRVAAQ